MLFCQNRLLQRKLVNMVHLDVLHFYKKNSSYKRCRKASKYFKFSQKTFNESNRPLQVLPTVKLFFAPKDAVEHHVHQQLSRYRI